jgi:hypothetical protein
MRLAASESELRTAAAAAAGRAEGAASRAAYAQNATSPSRELLILGSVALLLGGGAYLLFRRKPTR